jgi:F-type H+-transporting ATPase subunit a
MDIENISPDHVEYFRWEFVSLNATLVYTWLVMALLAGGAWLITRNLSTGVTLSRWQNLLEVLVSGIRDQIQSISGQQSDRYMPFIGTLFLFILVANILGVVPGFISPTGSLSTTVALAACVFFAVPFFGIWERGVWDYLKTYLQPTPFMLPFNIIGEFSRTLALAVRLFGNVLSGAKIVAILLAVTPLLFPVLMHALGLLTGVIQAYIFALLAMVFIASATQRQQAPAAQENPTAKGETHG